MSVIFCVVLLSSICLSEQISLIPSFLRRANAPINLTNIDDTKLNVPQLVEKYGYNIEVHHVTTEDGYVLEMHRIAGGPKSPPRAGKKVCYLQHGLVFSCYRLVDEGYDVWLGNSRGSSYSLKHSNHKSFGTLNHRKDFWSFSLDEIGYYDIPASIDYVLNATGESKLHYIGHSQGCTVFFMMASERPEYQNKIQTMHAMAPAVFLSNVESLLTRVPAPLTFPMMSAKKWLPIYYFYPLKLQQTMCRDIRAMQSVCVKLMNYFMGDTDQTNNTLVPIFFAHLPTGAGSNQLIHFGQFINSGHFSKFDYGAEENMIRYNSPTPPDYNLNKVTVPVSVYYGKTDLVTVAKDVKKLVRALPNVVNDYLVPHAKFNHVDFCTGIDTPRLVYDQIVQTLRKREIK